jgi:hypothetical protein
MAFLGEVPNLPSIVGRVPHYCYLLWCLSCSLLLWSERSVAILLLLKFLTVALELRRSAWLFHGRHVNNAELWWRSCRPTSDGSWHGPLPLLILGRFTSLHYALLKSGGAGEVVVRHVQIMDQVVQQLDIDPFAIELGLHSIIVDMMPTVGGDAEKEEMYRDTNEILTFGNET